MIIIWWIILIITILGYGMRMARWDADDVTVPSIFAELVGAGSQFFLLLTSYYYVTGGCP